MKKFSAPNCLKRMINTQKTYFAFSPDVKMMPANFFSVFKAFLKEYPVILILIPEVWTEEMKLLLHISYSTKLWFIPFLARIRIRNTFENSISLERPEHKEVDVYGDHVCLFVYIFLDRRPYFLVRGSLSSLIKDYESGKNRRKPRPTNSNCIENLFTKSF